MIALLRYNIPDIVIILAVLTILIMFLLTSLILFLKQIRRKYIDQIIFEIPEGYKVGEPKTDISKKGIQTITFKIYPK